MEKAKVKSFQYRASDTRKHQGDEQSIQKYLKEGFYVEESRNGSWVLVKPAKVLVTLEGVETGVTGSFDMKDDILSYLGKCEISQKALEVFRIACKNKQIRFEINEFGTNYAIWY